MRVRTGDGTNEGTPETGDTRTQEQDMSLHGFCCILLGAVLAQESTPARQSGKVLGQGETAPTITLTAPSGGWTVDRMVLVAGAPGRRCPGGDAEGDRR